jgi:hypothetical protein
VNRGTESPTAPREVGHRYLDPLDQIWLATAQRIGLRIERSGEVYASTDGTGALRIGTDATLDADDCLAQMIFHELCHALVEGPGSFAKPDWGLENIDARDLAREHACLRTQAALAGRHGLRALLAPTTDYRAFYDRLSEDTLAPLAGDAAAGAPPGDASVVAVGDAPGIAPGDPSIALARAALGRAHEPPWAPHLEAALRATAAIAGVVAPFATNSDEPPAGSLPPLWRLVASAPRR